MDPRIWPDATTWNPSRWTDEKGAGAEASELYTGGEQVDYGYGMVSKGTESPYQPFGAGRHRCVGEQFAYMQLSVIISYIVREFTLRLETPGREFPKTDYNVSRGPSQPSLSAVKLASGDMPNKYANFPDHDCQSSERSHVFHPSKGRCLGIG
jgi:cytochrome P450